MKKVPAKKAAVKKADAELAVETPAEVAPKPKKASKKAAE